MKLFFLEHPREVGSDYCNDIANTPRSSCLIIPSLIGNLEKEHEVRLGDGFLGKRCYEQLKEEILGLQPRIIGIHMIYQWDEHRRLKAFLKEIAAETEADIIVFGFYPSFAYEDLLNAIPEIRGVVIGEPEPAFFALAKGLSPEEAPSMAYRKADGTVGRNPTETVSNLDTLAFPRYSKELMSIGEVNIEGSRGCYNHCTFCYINDYYGSPCRWRGHSTDYVVGLIEKIIEETGNRRFYFVDPNFFGPGKNGQKRALEMAAKLKPLNIQFGIEARVNDIHEETITALIDAGLEEILIGLESGSQRCLDRLKKNTTVDQNERALSVLRKAGIAPNIGFIMFQPDSRPEDIRINFEFLKRNHLLEDVKLTSNLLYHNQILLMGSQCYREVKDIPTPRPYHIVLPYENESVGQLAAFMRGFTNKLFRAMTPLWSTFYREEDDVRQIYQKLNNLLIDTFEEVLTHEETEGLYKEEELEALKKQKESALEVLCQSIYDALPKNWREQGKIKTAPTC